MLWEWRGIANLAFIQLGWVSRVDEMILARVSSGFAGEEVWEDIQVVPGFIGAGKMALWFGIVLKIDIVFAERWANTQNIECFPSKCFLVVFENRNKMFLLIVFEQSGYDYWKKRIFF
ncbi:hypothetical protein Tco_0721531 [Tanacetum coccineum]